MVEEERNHNQEEVIVDEKEEWYRHLRNVAMGAFDERVSRLKLETKKEIDTPRNPIQPKKDSHPRTTTGKAKLNRK